MKIYILLVILIFILLLIILKTNLIYYPTEGPRDTFRYSLGDMILNHKMFTSYNKFWHNLYFRNTLATKYLNRASKTKDWDILFELVKENTKEKHIPPEDCLIIHLRIGDVIDWEYDGPIDDLLEGKRHYDYLFNYKKLENYIKVIQGKIKKIIMIGGYHYQGDHSRSDIYISKIEKFFTNKNFEIEKRINTSNADDDFLFMCNSKFFLQSGGNFSRAINKMVEMNNNITLVKSKI